jgi:hypothetical protein
MLMAKSEGYVAAIAVGDDGSDTPCSLTMFEAGPKPTVLDGDTRK